MLFAAFRRAVAKASLATPNSFIPKLANQCSRGKISTTDAAEFYLAARFIFSILLISLLDKSHLLVGVVGVVQVTSFIYLLKIIFPTEGSGLTDPNRSLFFALWHYLEIGFSMAYVYWVISPFGTAVEVTRVTALYFSFVTMTTIGYGDITPNTEVGKLLVVVHALASLFMLAAVVGMFLSLAASSKTDSKS